MTINAPETILSGQPTSGSCVASGNKYSWRPPYFFIRVRLVGSKNAGNCSIKQIGRFQHIGHAQYQQNFNITCNNGNSSVGIQCFTHMNDDTDKVYVQGTYLKH